MWELYCVKAIHFHAKFKVGCILDAGVRCNHESFNRLGLIICATNESDFHFCLFAKQMPHKIFKIIPIATMGANFIRFV